MNFWQSMWSPIRSLWSGRQSSGVQSAGPDGYAEPAAMHVSEQTALQLSAVWACVRLISQCVASLPVVVYRKDGGGRVVDNGHWLAKLMMSRPNRYQTRFEFWEHMVSNLVLHGNAYAKIARTGFGVASLLPLNPLQTETRLSAGEVVHLFTMDGNVDAFASESVWHAKLNSELIVGRSPLQFGRNVIAIGQAADSSVTKIYKNGGKPSGVLSFDKLLKKEQRAEIRESFNSLTTGTDERLLVLELGAKFDPISMSPQDIELLASRKYQVDEIARWFGVPSILINQNEGSTTLGSSTGEIMAAFYKLNLRPYLEALENSMQTWLFTEEDRATHEVEFDFEALLRADTKSRFDTYRVGIASAVLTPDEARAREGLPPKAGGDRLLIQGAMIPVEDAGKVAPKTSTQSEEIVSGA